MLAVTRLGMSHVSLLISLWPGLIDTKEILLKKELLLERSVRVQARAAVGDLKDGKQKGYY